MFCMLYVFFWVIPRRLNFICRRFGTLCLLHLHRQVGKYTYLPMKMEQTECSETSAYKIQTPDNYPEENIPQLQAVVKMVMPPLDSIGRRDLLNNKLTINFSEQPDLLLQVRVTVLW